jgi:glycosyltransferase involved in cell wall biosynthesis
MMAEAFAAAGHDVVLWTQDWSHAKKSRREIHPSGTAFDLRFVHVPGYGRNICLKRIWSHWQFARNWKAHADESESKPHLVVVSSPPLFIGREARRFCSRTGARCIVDIMDAWPETFERVVPRWTLSWMRSIAGDNYRAANGISAVTKSYIELAKGYGAKCPTHLCYHGIRLPQQPSERCKRDGALPVKLVYAGNMSLSYDLATVVDAVRSDEGLELDLAGSGPDEPSLRARAADCGRIRFHGYLGETELRSLLANADVGVVPMFDESCVGVPYKLADYVAVGLPVASSLHGETAELLASHNAGITYQAGDVTEFCRAAKLAAASGWSSASLIGLFDADRLYGEYVEFSSRITGSSFCAGSLSAMG